MVRRSIIKILKLNQFKQRKFYAKMINKDDLCFDIGANIGAKSRVFLSLGAKVVAFEPQKSCKKELELIKNKNFQYFSYAIGSNEELKDLFITNELEVATLSVDFMNYVKSANLHQIKTEKVTVKTLDVVVKKYGIPDFCKVDVEGFELAIFSSLSYELPLIEFEFTGGFLNDTIKIIKLLTKKHTKFNYNLNEKSDFELSKWVTSKELISIIKVLPKKKLHGNIFASNELVI